MKQVECDYCHNQFYKKDCLIGKHKHNFCSTDCYHWFNGRRIK